MFVMTEVDHPLYAVIFSLAIIVLGNFFMMNLILAVIYDTFVKLQEAEYKTALEQEQEICVSDDEFSSDLVKQLEQEKQLLNQSSASNSANQMFGMDDSQQQEISQQLKKKNT